ncbi:MAG: hypothetical protein ACK5PB_18485 [Pirellula sp.]
MNDKKPIRPQFLVLRHLIPGYLMLFLLGLAGTGCAPSGEAMTAADKQKQVISAKDRPPLKIALVDGKIAEELNIQWQASFEQPIVVENLAIDDLEDRKQDSTDIWIFPANLLGEMISNQRIGPLPQSAYGKPPSEEGDDSAAAKADSSIDSWPARWRGASRYGGTVFAMPLGVKPLAIFSKKIELNLLSAAEPTAGRSEELTQKSRDAWLQILQSMPTVARPENVEWNQQQLDRLVDHFLFIASTTNARYRGLFDISKMSAKLDSNDLVQSAIILSEFWRVAPQSILSSAPDAWELTRASPGESLGIGYPSKTGTMDSESDATMQVANVSWNPNHGLLVAVGKKTRQSAVANQFVQWLSAPEQRATFSRLDSRIELWPKQTDPNSGRSDYRLYTTLINKEGRPEPTSLLIRFDHSRLYRQKLAETLLGCIKSPEQSKSLLAECSKAWDKITEQNNAPQQRLSVEQSIGFSQ